jgi:AcrR family transcriptional regulator
MSTTPTARERLLAAANELFYAEGVHTVGIDRVIERAGVAKATLYNSFGSKDELVRAYLEGRYAITRKRLTDGLARYPTARERLIGVFEVQSGAFSSPEFKGCAFIRTSAESARGSVVEEVSDKFRGWLRSLLRDVATQAGASDPEQLASQLALLYDGANIGAWMDRNPATALVSQAMATVLVDAAIPS